MIKLVKPTDPERVLSAFGVMVSAILHFVRDSTNPDPDTSVEMVDAIAEFMSVAQETGFQDLLMPVRLLDFKDTGGEDIHRNLIRTRARARARSGG